MNLQSLFQIKVLPKWFVTKHHNARLSNYLGLLMALGVMGLWQTALAQSNQSLNYPNRPVKIIVPFTAGGPTDVQARWAAEQLSNALGQAFIVENIAGAGGVTGTDKVAKSPADGYTLLAGNPGPLTVAPGIKAQMPYQTMTDFVPIMLIARTGSCLTIHPSVPAKNVKEFIAYVKANPGKVNYGSPGVGTIGHLGMERFNYQAGISMNHIPYKGTSQYLNDLIAGHIQIAITQLAGCSTYVKQGKLVAIGATAEKRSILMPELPLVAEQGMPNYSSYNWNGILAPKGTPVAITQKIYEVLSQKMALKENQELFTGQGHEPGNITPEGFRNFLQQDLIRNTELAKVANIHE